MWVMGAPSGFKGNLTAVEAARVLSSALADLPVSVDECPLADGGMGTLAALAGALQLESSEVQVERHDGAVVMARVGCAGALAVIESADAVGLTLIPEAERRPLAYHSRGVGQLVRRALELGATEIWVGLGDSGVVDGGRGMMDALAGADLRGVRLVGLVDVDAPLVGPSGARRFMTQKGVPADALDAVEAELAKLHPAWHHAPGAGAAGGLGAAVLALGGALVSGAARIAEAVQLETRVGRASLVLTGEGSLDAQTLQGKAVGHLAAVCRAARKPLVALCGRVELAPEEARAAGLHATCALGADARATLGAAARGEVVRWLATAAPP